MGKVYASIDERNAAFIQAQHVFFVATAPTGLDGHLNLSPKGLDTFRILDPRTVAYLDLTGSGIETVAHLKENGRIVLMLYRYEGERTQLTAWTEHKGLKGLAAYRKEKNQRSIDGLPGL